jgi:hypothetical protein
MTKISDEMARRTWAHATSGGKYTQFFAEHLMGFCECGKRLDEESKNKRWALLLRFMAVTQSHSEDMMMNRWNIDSAVNWSARGSKMKQWKLLTVFMW